MTRDEAVAMMEDVFAAWNARDVPAMLRFFCDDLVFVEHAGDGGKSYKVRHGAKAFGDYLQTYLDVADCVSTLKFLTWDGIYMRTIIAFAVHHYATGLDYEGKFRQVIRVRDGRISHLDEYHDVDGSGRFWDLVGD